VCGNDGFDNALIKSYRLQINGDKPVVVDFCEYKRLESAHSLLKQAIPGATWCGPCKMISPHFEKAEATFENVVFVKVDVDEQPVRLIPLLRILRHRCLHP
jgi:thiol-disulfide isomerase/thioredoxin